MARKLIVEIIGDADSLERAFARSSKSAQRFQASISGVGSTITRGLAGFAGITTAAYGVTQAFQTGFDEMRESRRVAAQTAATIKSTGGVAGVTAKQVEDLADALLRKTAIDDEQIQSAENLLLTFTNVRNVVGENNDIFNQATQAALDMSTALGTDATTAALQLGKALQDPVRGITALRRAGVAFTTAQQAQIRNLVRTGRLLDAQKIILRELRTEFAGSAEAAAKADGGLQLLQVTIENFLGMVVEKFMPNIEAATKALQAWFDEPGNVDKVAKDVEDLAGAFAKFVSGAAEANRKGDEFMENLRRGMKRAAETGRAGLFGVLERLPSPGPLANWFKKEREESERELKQLKIEAAAAAVDIGAALKIRDRPTVAEMFPPAARGAKPPGTAGATARGGITAAQRNRWFDATIARQLNRLQDLSLQKQLAGLKVIAQTIRARIAATKDTTHRLNLEDDLLGVMREQRSVQEQITNKIKEGNELLKDRAEAIKSALIERLQRRQTDILNKRALQDAREQLRIARQIGGPKGIQQALRDMQDVQFEIQRARLEAAPATLTAGGRFALGNVVTINVNGVTDPDAVARRVAEVLQRKGKQKTNQRRGTRQAA